ncbi:transporter, memberof the SLC10 carrier family [Rhodotorula toruloides]|uniref:Transporter, memberof the SLC10 carrier family n=1 Tax=Rhodotorula toruloides TaxID=5286 RepID=A0A511KBP3_RHOTO|nr:transporter, memberof the SLC10 carrier family [Rhodotorula toruloides]
MKAVWDLLLAQFLRAGNWKLHLVCPITSFFLFPAVTFAIINVVRAANPLYKRFDRRAFVGMQVIAVLPMMVSSNVVMTGQAGGKDAATTVEVIGILFDTFLSPALLSFFMCSMTCSFGKPVASGIGGIGELYHQVIQQLGLTVFLPLTVGATLRYIWPKQVKRTRTTFRLGKVGSVRLLLVILSRFSGAVYEGAFEIVLARLSRSSYSSTSDSTW